MKILILVMLCMLTSCITAPPDILVCTVLNEHAGACTHDISAGRIDINDTDKLYEGKTWSQVVQEGVILPASSYSQQEEWTIAYCKKNNNCAQNHLTGITEAFKRFELLKQSTPQ